MNRSNANVNMELPFPFCPISKYTQLNVFHRTRWVAQCYLGNDLAASDFHIFPNLHMHMGGKNILSDQEMKSAVNSYLTKLDKSFYRTGIEKLVQQYE